jgi:hypothetical protein
MFGNKKVKTVCDNLCRATRIREDVLFKMAKLGPRI